MTLRNTALAACVLLGALGGVSMAEAAHDIRYAPAKRKSSITRDERKHRDKTKKAAQKARAKNRRR